MTGDVRTTFYSKKILGLTELGDRFLSYLMDRFDKFAAKVWGRSGWFDPIGLLADQVDRIHIHATGDGHGADNAGRLIDLPDYSLPFENALGVDYHVAALAREFPNSVETNARTGLFHYGSVAEVIGVLGAPDAVVDNGDGTITLTVDTITEAGVSNAGRTVKVCLGTAPRTGVAADAIETCVVAWTGGHNKITTAGSLGQGGAISTDPGVYSVLLQGPRVSRNTDLRTLAAYAYIGTTTGGGAGNVPSAVDLSDQHLFFEGAVGTLSDILFVCPHGWTKIRVRADGPDAPGDVQIAVYDNSLGVDVFEIHKDGSVKMGATLESTGTLLLKDANAAAGVPFSSATDTALNLVLGASTIIGGINQNVPVRLAVYNAIGDGLIAGGEVSDGGGLNADFAALSYLSGGRRFAIAGGSIAVGFGTTTYLYVNPSTNAVATTTTWAIARPLPLAKVVTTAGVITSITDLRRLVYHLGERGPITVGPTADCHFATIAEAVAFLGHYLGNHPSGTVFRTWEILVLGGTRETGTITMPVGGIRIRGVDNATDRIVWDGDVPLFDLNGKSDLAFECLNAYNDATSGGAIGATPASLMFRMTGASNVDRLTVRGCRLVSNAGHGFLANLGTGSLRDSVIEENNVSGFRDFAVHLGKSDNVRVAGNKFDRATAAAPASIYTAEVYADTARRLWIVDNLIDDFAGSGVFLDDVEDCVVRGNYIEAQADGIGIAISSSGSTSTANVVEGNRILLPTTAAGATAYGIVVHGTNTRVAQNYVEIGAGGDATTNPRGIDAYSAGTTDVTMIGNETVLDATGGLAPVGIYIGGPAPAGDRCIALGNNLHGAGITDLNGATTVVANNVL